MIRNIFDDLPDVVRTAIAGAVLASALGGAGIGGAVLGDNRGQTTVAASANSALSACYAEQARLQSELSRVRAQCGSRCQ